jgi:hypothetical protein
MSSFYSKMIFLVLVSAIDFDCSGQRYTIATETTPLPNKTVGAEVMQRYYDHWFNVTNTVLEVPNVLGSIAFQPMPRTITSKAKARGGVSAGSLHSI